MNPQYIIPEEDQLVMDAFMADYNELQRQIKRSYGYRLHVTIGFALIYFVIAFVNINYKLKVFSSPIQIILSLLMLVIWLALLPRTQKLGRIAIQRSEEFFSSANDPLLIGMLLDRNLWKSNRSKDAAVSAALRLLDGVNNCRPYHFTDKAMKQFLNILQYSSSMRTRHKCVQALLWMGDERAVNVLRNLLKPGYHQFWQGMDTQQQASVRKDIERILPYIEAKSRVSNEERRLLPPAVSEGNLLRPARNVESDTDVLLRAEIGSDDK